MNPSPSPSPSPSTSTPRARKPRSPSKPRVARARADRDLKPENITQEPSIAAAVVNLLAVLTYFADVPACDLGAVLHLVSHPDLLGAWLGVMRHDFGAVFVATQLPCALGGWLRLNDPAATAALAARAPDRVAVLPVAELLLACDVAGAGLGFGWVELRGPGLTGAPDGRGPVVDAPALRRALDAVAALPDRDGAVWLHAGDDGAAPELLIDGRDWVARVPRRFGVLSEHAHVVAVDRTAVAA